ncbi:Putrescine importer PuuP [Bacteroidales bacterium Barb6]|nr:Putrescine importer PuuP [Bacteroidales bacterium Barb6]OAV66306.1 Putrescine importer PuuP [Bacteroidales bacterium Barb4]
MSLFQKKSIDALQAEANDTGANTLVRVFGPWRLVALGIGAVIGAGLFSITGYAAADFAGPAITISFVVAALGCCLAGLCYAEFASMIPVAGSAYTYSYATMGEFIAWIIGWDLILEYALTAATVSISWSRYLVKFLDGFDIHLPDALTACLWDGGFINLPAAFIIVAMSLLLIRGTSSSATVNNVIVALKVLVVLGFIFLGWKYINTDNYVPYIPENTGTFGEYGFSGIIRAAAIVFFAYIGFDAVSTAAQETKNPSRNMPIGILGSLVICTILYIFFSHVMLGTTSYTEFKGHDGIAPVAIAIDHMGTGTFGTADFIPAYPWLGKAIVLAILFGYTSVILVMLLGQSRVFYSMSKDGLLPKKFSDVHAKYRTPYKSNQLFLVAVGIFVLFVPAKVAGELTSIGTLFAFILVCAGVLVLRKKMPNAQRAFKTPFVPLVPILGICVCLFMMVYLPFETWTRLLIWMLVGMDVYYLYGSKHSKIQEGKGITAKEKRTVSWVTVGIAFLLCVIAVLCYMSEGGLTSMIVSLVIAIAHLVPFTIAAFKK